MRDFVGPDWKLPAFNYRPTLARSLMQESPFLGTGKRRPVRYIDPRIDETIASPEMSVYQDDTVVGNIDPHRAPVAGGVSPEARGQAQPQNMEDPASLYGTIRSRARRRAEQEQQTLLQQLMQIGGGQY
jgi:hypothetical protein